MAEQKTFQPITALQYGGLPTQARRDSDEEKPWPITGLLISRLTKM